MRDRESDKERRRRRSRSRSNGRDRDEEHDRRKKSRRERSNSRTRSKSRSRERKSRRDREREGDKNRTRRSRSRSGEKNLKPKSSKEEKEVKPKSSSESATNQALDKEKQKEAEIAQLEEEMIKRRERVRLWQEAKAKQLAEAQAQASASNSASESKEGEHGEMRESSSEPAHAESNTMEEVDEDDEDKPRWTLEDDDEEEDAAAQSSAPDVPLAEPSVSLAPIKATEAEEEAVLALRPPTAKSIAPSSEKLEAEKLTATGDKGSRSSRFTKMEPVPPAVAEAKQPDPNEDFDPLEAFMNGLLQSGQVAEQKNLKNIELDAVKKPEPLKPVEPTHDEDSEFEGINYFGSNTITLDEIMKGSGSASISRGWESDAGESTANSPYRGPMDVVEAKEETEEEREAREEREKQEFLVAIRKAREEEEEMRSKLLRMDKELIAQAEHKKQKQDELGRVFEGEGDMADEFEIEQKKRSALEMLEEAKKGKLLKEVDHSKITYIPFRKNLYIVPKTLARLTEEQVLQKRDLLQVKVRGRGCPAPVNTWEQCGLADRILQCIYSHNLKEPFPIQKQAIPAIMCGRDVIGVAKTGSGKTLAFLLPLFRHIQDQPPLQDGEGPIGLVMAPARELAFQIYNEAKKFTKTLGMRVACIYGGAGVAEQIADLKRGSEIVVCTPGRMIDILTMQAGKLVSLKRVTMVILDEADRMFDMGFEPQIKMIIQNVRPDRQTILFSATFPKQIEKLAKTVLKLPLEIIVGERSTVNKDITQYIEVHEEEDKFLRLLQLLGIWYEKGSVLIFVDKQEKCDQLFQDLLKLGYPCLSLHGGKDQVDRDHTLHEFKTGIKTVMIATSVAGRGLDVPDIVCVINFNCPNHLEDYVHRVGRTGRAGRKGTAYTFLSTKEEQYAPIMVKALQKAGQTIPNELAELVKVFKEKVDKGEAHYSANGFVGKGFTFDANEMNETQKVAAMQRKAYEIEQGLVPDVDAEADDEFDEDIGEERAETVKPSLPAPAAPATVAGGVAQGGKALMSAVEKARAVAASLGASVGVPSNPSLVSASTSSSSAVPSQAAMAKARQIAQQITIKRPTGETGPVISSEELDINDYPANVRKKVVNKNSFDDIMERTGVYIVSRGTYVPSTRKPEPGERRLHLVFESDSEMSVRQAKMEMQRMLEEETIKMSSQSGMGGGGRYSVI